MGMVSGALGTAGVGITEGGRVGIRESRPLPRALRGFSALFMVQNLFRQFDVAFGASGAGIVAEDGFAETGRFGKTNAAWNDRLKDFVAEELLEVMGDLTGEVRAV